MNAENTLLKNYKKAIFVLEKACEDVELRHSFNAASQLVLNCYRNGGRLYIGGNGGSAADAQHLAAEFVSKLAKDRAPLAAEALTVDSSVLTAIGNDYGFDNLFARQLRAKATPLDVFLGITTSGASHNILKALDVCREIGTPSIIFTGRDGGEANRKADISLIIPAQETASIQEVHIILAHSLCEFIESEIFKGR